MRLKGWGNRGVPKGSLKRLKANKLLTFKRILDKKPRPILKKDACKLISKCGEVKDHV